MKKKSIYRKSLIIFVISMAFLVVSSWIYVYESLATYENSDIDNYMSKLVSKVKNSALDGRIGDLVELYEINNNYEKNPSLDQGYKELFSNGEASYRIKDDSYIITVDDEDIFNVNLAFGKLERKFGLLTYKKVKLNSIEPVNKDGLYSYEIYALSNYKVYVNDILIDEKDLVESKVFDEYAEINDKVSLTKISHYKVSGLSNKASIKVKDSNDKEVSLEVNKNVYEAIKLNVVNELPADYKVKPFDELEFAKNWSLFMSDDLKGDKHGLNKLTSNLLPNTGLYDMAVSWATGIDITFTSKHTLARDTFTDINVSNYTIYSDQAYSVDISFKKNMYIAGNKTLFVDDFNEKLFIAYVDGNYRVIRMENIK